MGVYETYTKVSNKGMQRAELQKLMSDANVMGTRLSSREVEGIMDAAQSDDDDSLSYDEFKEIVCVIAFYQDASPYRPRAKRLRNFVTKIFLSNLLKGKHIRGIKEPFGDFDPMTMSGPGYLKQHGSEKHSKHKPDKADPKPDKADPK